MHVPMVIRVLVWRRGRTYPWGGGGGGALVRTCNSTGFLRGLPRVQQLLFWTAANSTGHSSTQQPTSRYGPAAAFPTNAADATFAENFYSMRRRRLRSATELQTTYGPLSLTDKIYSLCAQVCRLVVLPAIPSGPPPPTPPLGSREGRIGQGGRGRTQGGERPRGTTAYGGKGSKGRAANGDRPVGAASGRRDQYTMATCQTPHPCPTDCAWGMARRGGGGGG